MSGVSAVVVTRARPREAERAVASLLTCPRSNFEVVVVDQGGWLGDLGRDPRLTHLRPHQQGLSRGRNTGIAAARFERIAFTDDDCTVATDWADRVAAAFDEAPGAGVIFGNVLPAPHDPARGVVPAHRSRRLRVVGAGQVVEGMGACMLVHRDAWRRVGGFDVRLGAGARFPAGEELDFSLRCRWAGFAACETPDVSVLHHGFRTHAEAAALTSGYWRGTGAVFSKHLRRGRLEVLVLLARLGVRFLAGGSAVATSLGASRRARLSGFVRGLAEGLMIQGEVPG